MDRSLPWALVLLCLHAVAGAVEAPNEGATVLYLEYVDLYLPYHDITYERLGIRGEGPQYREVSGIGSVWLSKDDSEFRVNYVNNLDEVTTIHQHGLTPPTNLDGVPFLSQLPIYPGRQHLYVFDILRPQNEGTYFLHSHYGFHQDAGLSIPAIVEGDSPEGYPMASEIDSATDVVMFLEDFCPYAAKEPDQNPTCTDTMAVYNTLKSTWESVQPYPMDECLGLEDTDGHRDMDFRYHLVNDRTIEDAMTVRVARGEHVRFRMVSSTAFSEYKVDFGALEVTLFAVDGQFIEPFSTGHVYLEVGQRADVYFRAPDADVVLPVIAHVDDLVKSGLMILVGDVEAPAQGTYTMNMRQESGFLSEEPSSFVAFEQALRAWNPLDDRPVDRMIYMNMTGNNGFLSMNEYSWQMPPIADEFTPNPNPIQVIQGERVCIEMTNFNPFPHPMHLHGHSFQVVELAGERFSGAYRDTVTSPLGHCKTTTICFTADNPGIWAFHCHKAIHGAAGMMTTVEYIPGGLPPPVQEASTSESGSEESLDASGIVAVVLVVCLVVISGLAYAVRRSGGAEGGCFTMEPKSNGGPGSDIPMKPVRLEEADDDAI
eukprot:Rmarinus@m.8861